MDNKEKKNEQDMINTQVEPHNHRAIIGFDKNGVPKVLVSVQLIAKHFRQSRMCWTMCRTRQSKK